MRRARQGRTGLGPLLPPSHLAELRTELEEKQRFLRHRKGAQTASYWVRSGSYLSPTVKGLHKSALYSRLLLQLKDVHAARVTEIGLHSPICCRA